MRDTPLVYNTLSKKLEELKTIEQNKVTMYICGPTVYDSPHIGHARTYIAFDVIRNILSEYFGYDVIFVMNITNIDDKIITRAAERKITCDELSKIYEDEFFNEMDKLGVRRPDFVTRVTEYIDENIKFVEGLEKRGYAYEANGSVYFDMESYQKDHKYNLLRPKTEMNEEEEKNAEKKRSEDFVLWKASKAGEPAYKTKWGMGRPGWHIECSAMSSSIFGPKLDIHAGGIDLAFPHHENEIAQCQGLFGEKWVNYFVHTGHLNIEGQKMSKSLKNFTMIQEILDIVSPQAIRILFIQHMWNKTMNYEENQLQEAESIKKRIFTFISAAEARGRKGDIRSLNEKDKETLGKIEELKRKAHEEMVNNFNTPRVLDFLLQMISLVNSNIFILHSDIVGIARKYVVKIMKIFGVYSEGMGESAGSELKLANLLKDFREKVRIAAKSKAEPKVYFDLSDGLRDEIKDCGFVIEDNKHGGSLRKDLE